LGVGSKAKDEKVTEDHDKHAGHVHKRSLGDDHEEHTNRVRTLIFSVRW